MKFLNYVFKSLILKSFFLIELSSNERTVGEDSIADKYAPVLRNSIILTFLATPAILLFDSSVVVNVLIPITMVAGTAWFSISLASVKKKFENFGIELTTDVLESFVSSLLLLLVISFSALNAVSIDPALEKIKNIPEIGVLAGILGSIVVGRIIIKIFFGAVKYDINDAMLAGQAEIAEKFFKKSLSFFHESAVSLRHGKSLDVANYHIGNSFFELFSFIQTNLKSRNLRNGKLAALIEQARKIKNNPGLPQDEIDKISINLIEKFLGYCKITGDEKAEKSIDNIRGELKAILENKDESQKMVDTRFATILSEIAELLENNGESLFIDKNDI